MPLPAPVPTPHTVMLRATLSPFSDDACVSLGQPFVGGTEADPTFKTRPQRFNKGTSSAHVTEIISVSVPAIPVCSLSPLSLFFCLFVCMLACLLFKYLEIFKNNPSTWMSPYPGLESTRYLQGSALDHGKCQITFSSQCHHVEPVVIGEEVPGHPLASCEDVESLAVPLWTLNFPEVIFLGFVPMVADSFSFSFLFSARISYR